MNNDENKLIHYHFIISRMHCLESMEFSLWNGTCSPYPALIPSDWSAKTNTNKEMKMKSMKGAVVLTSLTTMASALTAQAIIYPLPGTDDQQWYANGDVTVMKISVSADYAPGTIFGIYDISGSGSMIEIFGSNTLEPFPRTVDVTFQSNGDISINGTVRGNFGAYTTTPPEAYFGFYLDTKAYNNNIWYSESDKNSDKFDHMHTTVNPEQYINYELGWEDIVGGGDKDFNDIVIQLSSSQSEPQAPDGGSTAALLGGAMLVLGGYRRLRR